jgi:hypothetical protein
LILDLPTERSEPTEPIFGINKSYANLVSVIRKIGSDHSDRSVPHQKVNYVVIFKFMYHTAALTTWTARKQKQASRLGKTENAAREPSPASRPARKESISTWRVQERGGWKAARGVQKFRKSISAIAHLRNL